MKPEASHIQSTNSLACSYFEMVDCNFKYESFNNDSI